MHKLTRWATLLTYSLVGAVLLAVGGIILLYNTTLLPQALRSQVLVFGHGDLNVVHLLQEFAATMVLVGLVTLWFMRHYAQSWAFHWFVTLYFAIIMLVHWFDVRGPEEDVTGAVVIAVPFALFLVLGLLRLATERQSPVPRSSP